MKYYFVIAVLLLLAGCTETVEKQPITYLEDTVYISSATIKEFNDNFNANTVEVQYCLFGEASNNSIIITSVQEAEYIEQTPTYNTIKDCPVDKIGYIHSHPNTNCRFSGDDEYNLNNEGLLEGVLCGEDRIVFYTVNSYKTKESLRIINIDTGKDITLKAPYCPPGGLFCDGGCWEQCESGEFVCPDTGGPYCNA